MSNATQPLEDCSETITATAMMETRPDSTEELPLLFGRYRTIRELGQGGMGVVVLAHDAVLDLQVALKMIPQTVLRDTEGIADLKKEVLRGMELTHPGIVRVFSFEQDATTAAIVMEYVQGQSLAQKKAEQPARCFDCEEVLPWLEQLCAALDYAHAEARIAHRDLKPGNLMLTTNGRLKVADFGIASSLSDTLSRISVRSDSSGTPPYMSPQQAMGQRPSHLDDIYSLGATVYELLTGKPPFFRGNILAQLMQEEPVSMAQRREEFGITGMKPIPAAWERVVAGCLVKEPADRPQSGAAILDLLKNQERAIALRPPVAVAVQDLKLQALPEALQSAPSPQIRPAKTAKTAEVVSWRPDEPSEPREPSVVLGFVAGLVSGTWELIGAIVRPVFKIAVVLGALWGLLHIKGKWDAQQAERAAAAAKLQASQQAAQADALSARPQQPVLQPGPFQPPPPRPQPGMGPGGPPPHFPGHPPPPPRR
jgi:serine/threonine protein kinase